jgi:hypothetical protein
MVVCKLGKEFEKFEKSYREKFGEYPSRMECWNAALELLETQKPVESTAEKTEALC